MILNDKEGGILVDGKIRRDRGFPLGFMDVLTLPKTKENFRILYDAKGRFVVKSIDENEAKVYFVVNLVQIIKDQRQSCRS